jgi:G:T/U-mismatch repair DNA glycosylase
MPSFKEEIEVWKEKATKESQRVKLTEEQHCGVRENLEEQLRKMYESNQQLYEQVERYAASTEYLKDMLARCFEGLGTALPVLEEMKKGVSSVVVS